MSLGGTLSLFYCLRLMFFYLFWVRPNNWVQWRDGRVTVFQTPLEFIMSAECPGDCDLVMPKS